MSRVALPYILADAQRRTLTAGWDQPDTTEFQLLRNIGDAALYVRPAPRGCWIAMRDHLSVKVEGDALLTIPRHHNARLIDHTWIDDAAILVSFDLQPPGEPEMTETKFTALYKVGPSQSTDPTDIQVQDQYGNQWPMPLERYIERGVQPPWQELTEWQEGTPE